MHGSFFGREKQVLQLIMLSNTFKINLDVNENEQLQDNDTEMYSVRNEEKSAVAKGRTLKNKIYKRTTLISKNVYILIKQIIDHSNT